MKSTGEAMAIDRSFEAALQKAVRSLEVRNRDLLWEDAAWHASDLERLIREPNDLRLWALMAALRRSITPETLSGWSGIDPFFLYKLQKIVECERLLLEAAELTPALARRAKRLGFSDRQMGTLLDEMPERLRDRRREWGVIPTYKMVDTCAAEFEAATPYFYGTYESENEAEPLAGSKVVVLGSGPIRIGQGIEFDYCSVRAALALREHAVASIMINSNPETVSTDFDASSRLYFEPLDEESVRDVLDNETCVGGQPPAILAQFGGQTAINLAEPLVHAGHRLLGSDLHAIDVAEDRDQFSDLLDNLGIPQPPGGIVSTPEEAVRLADQLGYPVLVRPSFVLGGRAMEICRDATELSEFAAIAKDISGKKPLLVDKYLEGVEIEVDAICDGVDVLVPGIMQHVERAGVHSGDSIALYPAPLEPELIETVSRYTAELGRALGVRGLFNIQYVVFEGVVYVIEVNPRGSRTVPFLSKVTGVPMVDLAVQCALGARLGDLGYGTGLWPAQPLVAAKAPVFSMSKLTQVDTYLGPEMKSTGEVMGLGESAPEALGKALIAAGIGLPEPGAAILLSLAMRDTAEAMPLVRVVGQPALRPAGDRRHRRAHPPSAGNHRGEHHQEAERGPPQRRRRHPVRPCLGRGEHDHRRSGAVARWVFHPSRRHRAAHPMLHEPGHTARRPPGLWSAGAPAPGANRRRVPPGADGLGARRRLAGLNSTLAGLREPSRPGRGLRQDI